MSIRNLVSMVLMGVLATGCVGESAPSASIEACGASNENACRVTFRRLVEAPESFAGRVVRVDGYLGVKRGFFTLNSSKELFDAGVSDEVSIRIRGSADLQQKIFDEYSYTWVSIIGTFRLKSKNGTVSDLLIGELHPPLEVNSLGYPGSERNQSFNDAALDLEDLK